MRDGPRPSNTSNTTTGAHVRLGQREFGSADDVLLPHAILLCAVLPITTSTFCRAALPQRLQNSLPASCGQADMLA